MEGVPTLSASNGLEAVERVASERPGLVLLDMRMPVCDGWQFMKLLRDHKLEVPVVVMTAASSARAWATEIEAQGVLPKPFNLDDLIGIVGEYV
jgi:CheY-like chemotaxis protein